MPYRLTPFINDNYYHIFNRGVEKRPIFTNKRDYDRFKLAMSYYRFAKPPIKLSLFLITSRADREKILNKMNNKPDKLVTINAFALMPNHFHILLRQEKDGGIKQFLSNLNNSYSKYYNTKNNRVGPLMQGPFKAVLVENEEQLLHVSRYIHLNPVTSCIIDVKHLKTYPNTSLPMYVSQDKNLVDSKIILDFFTNTEQYLKFIFDQIDYVNKLENIQHLAIDKKD
jgi:putative transposase